uniref:Retrotransposon gag domain-containing protein n=1 Tax=Aegilops tauschii subsp. strangulata TaxID=200361 RepID=A0A453DRQ9_AEGTS
MRCEDYFRFWNTPSHQWIPSATSLFEGTAARWLESVQHRVPGVGWLEFCALLQSRFGRNKHQHILRQMFNIRQTSMVEDYVERFSELFDQLTAYEPNPSQVHYVTGFMEGLVPSVRLLVGIQQPSDLDSAYALAILSEELDDHSLQPSLSISSVSHSKKNFLPSARGVAVSKIVEDRHASESN